MEKIKNWIKNDLIYVREVTHSDGFIKKNIEVNPIILFIILLGVLGFAAWAFMGV